MNRAGLRLVFGLAVVAGVIVGGAIASIRLLGGSSGGSTQASSAPTATPAAGSPASTAGEFAKDWTAGNTKALYLLLTPQSQQTVSFDQFTNTYASFSRSTTEQNLTARVSSVQGNRATLAVRLQTAYFGTLEYTTALNLVPASPAALVNWTSETLYPGMTAGLRMKGTVQDPIRGAIYDRNGKPLAINEDVPMLGLDRSLVTDRAALTTAVTALGFSADAVNAAFASTLAPDDRVPIGPVPSGVQDTAKVIAGQNPGLLYYTQSERVHPLGPAGAQVIGYTRELNADELKKLGGEGYFPGDRTGAVGIEAGENDRLAGKPGGTLQLVDANDNVIKTLVSRPYVAGQDVHTTLDANILQAAQTELGSEPGASIVMDPRTNEILAINSNPSFDPNAFEQGNSAAISAALNDKDGPLSDRATNGLYSSGSTFKLITAAAGLVYGGFTPQSTLPCPPVWDGVSPPRKNWESIDRGNLTISEGLEHSCNPVFYQIGLTLNNKDPDLLPKMARLFGFGAPTGVAGIAEEGGLVPDPQWKQKTKNQPWYPGDSVNLAIGQGYLLITPLQLANAYSSFFAGELRTPVLIQGEPATVKNKLPLTPDQSAALTLGLKLVTGPNGTAASVFADAGYTDFLGKSGTAEDTGQQSHVDFVAAAPAGGPTVLCTVFLDHGTSGSTQAGPIARDIVLDALKNH